MEFVQINDETFSFNWVCLTPKARQIFKYLQYKSRENRFVFPSLKRIAEVCSCAIATVKRWITKFIQWNWMSRYKRPYQSNLYTLIDYLINVDIDDSSFLANKRAPVELRDELRNEPVLDIQDPLIPKNPSSKDTCTAGCACAAKKSMKENVQSSIEESKRLLRDLPLHDREKDFLAKEYSYERLVQALHDAQWYQGRGNVIDNWVGYIRRAANFWNKKEDNRRYKYSK